MMKILQGWIFWIWPPFEYWVVKRRLLATSDLSSEWDPFIKSLQTALEGIKDEEFAAFAKQIAESEVKRREILEAKAAGLIQASGMATAIVAMVPTLFSSTGWNLPSVWGGIVGALYLCSLIHLWVSMYYAVEVRRLSQIVLPSADEFLDFAQSTRQKLKFQQPLFDVGRAKLNEKALTLKSNSLTVAEDMFLRGLAMLASGAVIAVSCLFFRSLE